MQTFLLVLALNNAPFTRLEGVSLSLAECHKLGNEWLEWIHDQALTPEYSFNCLNDFHTPPHQTDHDLCQLVVDEDMYGK